MRMIIKWIICCGVIILAWQIFPNYVDFSGSWAIALGMGTVLWLINIIIRPFAQLISIVATILTLGLFSLIVNAAMVWLADLIIPAINIDSFWIYLFIAVIIAIGNAILVPKKRIEQVS